MVTSEFLPIGLLSLMAADLGTSAGRAGLLVTVPGAVAAVAAPVGAVLAGKADRRRLLLWLSVLIFISNGWIAVAGSFGEVLAARFLLGLSVGGFWTFAAAAGRRMVTPSQGNRATMLILTGISAGTVLGVPIGTAIGSAAGWRPAFAGVAALSLVVLLAQLALLPRLPGGEPATPRAFLALLRVRRAAFGFVAAGLAAAGHFAAYTYLEPFLSGAAGFRANALSWTLAAYGIAGIAGTFAGERAGSRDIRATFVGVAVLMGLAIFLAASLSAFPRWTAVLVVLWGAAFGALNVCIQVWTFEAAPEQFEAGSAVMVTVFQVALATGAFAGGIVIDEAGTLAPFLTAAALCLLCALTILAAGPATHSRHQPSAHLTSRDHCAGKRYGKRNIKDPTCAEP
jgi:predicted MFS family arabinose efflux permease